jgi:hypothetical protein
LDKDCQRCFKYCDGSSSAHPINKFDDLGSSLANSFCNLQQKFYLVGYPGSELSNFFSKKDFYFSFTQHLDPTRFSYGKMTFKQDPKEEEIHPFMSGLRIQGFVAPNLILYH